MRQKEARIEETTYKEWKDKVDSYLLEGPDEGEAFRRVKASLKGLALSQIKDCQTAIDVSETLKKLYGEVQTPEVQMKPKKGEKPSDFFARVWDCFVHLNDNGSYND